MERSAGAPVTATAHEAFERVAPSTRRLDRTFRLKHVSAPAGIGVDGRSACWSFLFDLPRRRAQVSADWTLVWDEASDAWSRAIAASIARPFPPLGGLVRRQVEEGRILYRQMASQWLDERARTPDLPVPFVDSDRALEALATRGLDASEAEVQLATGVDDAGEPVWIGTTRDREASVPFAADAPRSAA